MHDSYRLVVATIALAIMNVHVSSCLAVAATNDRSPRTASKPNIVIILIDDMGFNDVSFHGSNQVLTPNIDALAYNGIILNRHYVPNLCTPSRATLLTGKYPIHTGTQHFVIINDEPWGLPLTERLMPEFFREAGYSTNLIGKWHLGFWQKEHTPVMRGFDHHYGYYSGYIDYYDHSLHMLNRNYSKGLDFRRDLLPWAEANGSYATDVFTEEAVRVIGEHNKEQPLFLVMSHLAVHTGNEDNPMQAPAEEVDKFQHIADAKRRTYAGMISKLDQSVADTMKALSDRGMLDNTIVLLYSDNGAPTVGIHSNAGSNFPFRGQKETPWEGGIRSAGLLWSPLLQERNYVSEQVLHAADWLPTLAGAAGVRIPDDVQLDGLNMWPALSERHEPQPRQLVHVLDEIFGYSSYMHGDWKYVNGSSFDGAYDDWLGGDLHEYESEADPFAVRYGQVVLSSEVHSMLGSKHLDVESLNKLRAQATVRCPVTVRDPASATCRPLEAPCLFNIVDDPCERYNLATANPVQLQVLAAELEEIRLTAVRSARVAYSDRLADPSLHNGLWEWWGVSKDDACNEGNCMSVQVYWSGFLIGVCVFYRYTFMV